MKNLIMGITFSVSTLFTGLAIASPQLDEFGIDPNASYSGKRLMQTEQGSFEAFIRQAPDKNAYGNEHAWPNVGDHYTRRSWQKLYAHAVAKKLHEH